MGISNRRRLFYHWQDVSAALLHLPVWMAQQRHQAVSTRYSQSRKAAYTQAFCPACLYGNSGLTGIAAKAWAMPLPCYRECDSMLAPSCLYIQL